ncbi:hypothetical protein [Sphaerisporangium sp. NPDC051011]|uniref:hypothetical protein n=1 Tax=Sphaerisporangium sp. NPDC051011 TaxID=3155792 RepID=UPI0033E7F8ED
MSHAARMVINGITAVFAMARACRQGVVRRPRRAVGGQGVGWWQGLVVAGVYGGEGVRCGPRGS